MSLNGHLSSPAVASQAQATYPRADGPPCALCSVLLRMGFTCAPAVTSRAVVSYTALPPLPGKPWAVHFCCTILGVASTRRYLASCPVKPGLSSPAAFRFCSRDHLSYSKTFITLPYFQAFVQSNHTLKQLPPINSLHNRIVRHLFAADTQKIIEKFEQPLRLVILRLNHAEHYISIGSAYCLSTESSYKSAELNIASASS